MPMATTTSQAASSGTAAAIGETIVGSHVFRIDGFSATKDLGVGKSIKSSTFNVGGHGWYIEWYPCGEDDEEKDGGWVSLFLCLSVHKEQVEAGCEFSLLGDGEFLTTLFRESKHTFNADTLWRCGRAHIKRKWLESLVEGDCFQVICDVYIAGEFPAVPPLGLHRPLSDLHRGLAEDSLASAGASTTARSSADDNDNVVGSHVLTIDGYSKTKKVSRCFNSIDSNFFFVRGWRWYLELKLYPGSEEQSNNDYLAVSLCAYECDDLVKVRFTLTLLTLAREIISSSQFYHAFTDTNDRFVCHLPFAMEPHSSLLLGDSFHIRCDVTIVKEITPARLPDLHQHFGDLLTTQVGTDVEFEVAGDLFPAHKCVLATRSTAFMAEFFGPAGRDSTASSVVVSRVRIDGMEPNVFRALLHFIYTDALPEVREDDDDRIAMAQGLLVAADRYAMERLKLICADMLCSYVNDAPTAVDTLELADKHGCRRLKEACMKLLKGHFAKVAP